MGEKLSMNDNKECQIILSISMSICGRAKTSLGLALFKSKIHANLYLTILLQELCWLATLDAPLLLEIQH